MEWKDLLLILIGTLTGFINTVAGGGSVIILPVLILFFGLPPTVANGTNRIGIIVQTVFSALGFKSKNVTPFALGVKKSIFLGLITLAGALIGASIAIDFPEKWFNRVLSIVMLCVLILTIWKPKPSSLLTQNPKIGYLFSVFIFFIIGIYAGFIQAGTGFLMILAFSYLNNLSLVQSNAMKTLVVFLLTIGAIYIFAINGTINLKYGILLAIGNAMGGWFASRWSVKKGDRVIQIFMVLAVSVMAIKLWFY